MNPGNMENFQNTEKEIHKPKLDLKGEGERINPEELEHMLREYGEVEASATVSPYGSNSWAMTFKPYPSLGIGDVEYTLIVPEGAFRRREDTTKDPIGVKIDGSPMYPMVPLSPDDSSAMTNEIQVVLLDNSPRDQAFIKDWLKDTAEHGMLMGQEIEFGIQEYDIDTKEGKERAARRAFSLCKEGLVEAFLNMRELSEELPAENFKDFKNSLVRIQKEIFKEAKDEAYILEFTNTMAQKVPLKEEPYTALKAEHFELLPPKAQQSLGYLDAATNAYTAKMLQNLSFILSKDQDVLKVLNQIAHTHGITSDPKYPARSPGEIFVRTYLFDAWMARALHISVGVPQHKDGMIPQSAMKGAVNGGIYWSEIVNVLNYSGNMIHGAKTHLPNSKGEVVDILSGRSVLRNIIPTSRAPGLIPPETDFKLLKEELLLKGLANSFDRTTGKIEIETPSGITRTYAPMHSEVRSRDSVSFAKFLKFLEKSKEGESPKLTTGARLEFTGPDLTPEVFGGNTYAVALRAVITRAAMIGATEKKETEKFDFIKWLEKNNILKDTTVSQVYKTHDSQGVHENLMKATRGELDLNKIKQLEELIDLVEKKTVEEFHENKKNSKLPLPSHWVELFTDARKGIEEIKNVRSMFSSHREMWAKVIDGIRKKWAEKGNVGGAGIEMYEAFCSKGGGSAAMVNFLTNTEIATILIDKFKVSKIRVPEKDGKFKEIKLDEEILKHWINGEEKMGQDYNDARAYLITLLFHMHAEEAMRKYEASVD